MRLIRREFSVLILMIGMALGVGALTTGCATNQQAYGATRLVATTVDAAMNAWGDTVRAGLASAEDEATVRSIYETYQGSMRTLRLVAQSYYAGDIDRTAFEKALDAVEASRKEAIDTIMALINTKPAIKYYYYIP